MCTSGIIAGPGSTYFIGRLVQGMVNSYLYDQQQKAHKDRRQDNAAITSRVSLLIHQIFAA